MRTYGRLTYDPSSRKWLMTSIPPNVAIRLKQLFPRIPKSETTVFSFDDAEDQCADLAWFMDRYPLEMSETDLARLNAQTTLFREHQDELERILLDGYVPPEYVGLKAGQKVRQYQAQAVEVVNRSRRLLLGDDLGLGKTYSAIAMYLAGHPVGELPAAVVVQTHLQDQWEEKIREFSTLTVHKIKGTKPYELPPADVFIFKYSQLLGWIDVFRTGRFKRVAYDEVQELRTGTESGKGKAAREMSIHAGVVMGLSATPIFNYGGEIWNIYRCMASDVLGSREDFEREWLCDEKKVKDPEALGAYLREQHVFLRRLKSDVGQQMPKVNVLHEIVESDESAFQGIDAIARSLASTALTGSFTERGQALRELDMMVRRATGVGKARSVAAYARILLEGGVPIILCGWHRDVYDIWLEELAEFKPVMYTGTESPKQKREAKEAFVSGRTNLFIMSNRSGAGLDGLQFRCSWIIFGELDWSKKVHEQLTGRLDREGQQEQVTAIYLTSEDGSDPPILDVLAIKESQSAGIVDPGKEFTSGVSDGSRLKALAAAYLGKAEYKKLSEVIDNEQVLEHQPAEPQAQLELV